MKRVALEEQIADSARLEGELGHNLTRFGYGG